MVLTTTWMASLHFFGTETEEVGSDVVTVPNIITSLGLCLTVVYIYCFLTHTWEAYIPTIVVMVAISDMLDGMAARVLHQHTHLGKVLDPVRDRLFGIAMLANITLWEPRLIALTGAIVGTELIIGGIHTYQLVVMGKISWRAKHTSGKIRQAIHLAGAGIFTYQAYWQDSPLTQVPVVIIVAAMLVASLSALAMLGWVRISVRHVLA